MYGPDEHRETLIATCLAYGEIHAAQSRLSVLRRDLHEDDASATRDAREHLRAANLLLERAKKACKEAFAALPTPAARPDYPAAYDALHEGHR